VPCRDVPGTSVAGPRVAVLREIDGFTPAPAIRRGLDKAAEALRAAGALVEPWDQAPDTGQAIAIGMRMWTADGGTWMRQLLGDEKPHPIIKADAQAASLPNVAVRALAAYLRATGQHQTANLLRHMRKASARELSDLLGDKLTYLETFVAALDAGNYDLVLCPATPIPAAPTA
jgi:fatty acid amide hydrolase